VWCALALRWQYVCVCLCLAHTSATRLAPLATTYLSPACRDVCPHADAHVSAGERRVSLTVRRVLKVKDSDERIFTADAIAEQRRKDKWWLASRGEEGLSRGFY
jgi:hypothetical protein